MIDLSCQNFIRRALVSSSTIAPYLDPKGIGLTLDTSDSHSSIAAFHCRYVIPGLSPNRPDPVVDCYSIVWLYLRRSCSQLTVQNASFSQQVQVLTIPSSGADLATF